MPRLHDRQDADHSSADPTARPPGDSVHGIEEGCRSRQAQQGSAARLQRGETGHDRAQAILGLELAARGARQAEDLRFYNEARPESETLLQIIGGHAPRAEDIHAVKGVASAPERSRIDHEPAVECPLDAAQAQQRAVATGLRLLAAVRRGDEKHPVAAARRVLWQREGDSRRRRRHPSAPECEDPQQFSVLHPQIDRVRGRGPKRAREVRVAGVAGWAQPTRDEARASEDSASARRRPVSQAHLPHLEDVRRGQSDLASVRLSDFH